MIAAFAVIVLRILSSAHPAPSDPPSLSGFQGIDSPRPAPLLLSAAEPGPRSDEASQAGPKQPAPGPAFDGRFASFNGHLIKSGSGERRARVRTPRPQPVPPESNRPSVRGINVDVVTSRVTRPMEIGRNGTASAAARP